MLSLPVLIDADPVADTASATALLSREPQAAFLAATGNVRSAAARAGVSHQTA